MKINVPTAVPYLHLACENHPDIGQTVFTIGNPLGILDNTFAQGLVSGVRQLKDRTLIQTSAPISHGSSGGPLLDDTGQVVGITTATIGEGQNLNFAVPAKDACELMSKQGEPRLLMLFFQDKPSAEAASTVTGQETANTPEPLAKLRQ